MRLPNVWSNNPRQNRTNQLAGLYSDPGDTDGTQRFDDGAGGAVSVFHAMPVLPFYGANLDLHHDNIQFNKPDAYDTNKVWDKRTSGGDSWDIDYDNSRGIVCKLQTSAGADEYVFLQSKNPVMRIADGKSHLVRIKVKIDDYLESGGAGSDAQVFFGLCDQYTDETLFDQRGNYDDPFIALDSGGTGNGLFDAKICDGGSYSLRTANYYYTEDSANEWATYTLVYNSDTKVCTYEIWTPGGDINERSSMSVSSSVDTALKSEDLYLTFGIKNTTGKKQTAHIEEITYVVWDN